MEKTMKGTKGNTDATTTIISHASATITWQPNAEADDKPKSFDWWLWHRAEKVVGDYCGTCEEWARDVDWYETEYYYSTGGKRACGDEHVRKGYCDYMELMIDDMIRAFWEDAAEGKFGQEPITDDSIGDILEDYLDHADLYAWDEMPWYDYMEDVKEDYDDDEDDVDEEDED